MLPQDPDIISDLMLRIESLEAKVGDLQTRLAGLEAGEGVGGRTDFQMPDEEQTV